MGMTALRNKRGIMAGDHTGKVGPGAGGPPDAATLKRISEIARTQGPDAAHAAVGKLAGPQAQQAVAQAGQTMAPRYQKMLADGVDPGVVAKRQEEFQARQLPGQPGNKPPTGDLPVQAKPAFLPNGGGAQTPGIVPPMQRGGLPTPTASPDGRQTPPIWAGPGVGPTAGKPSGPTGLQSANGGGLQAGPMTLPNGLPMQTGGALSPNAWGALGGGSLSPMIPNESGGALLPNGQPMGGVGAAANAALGAYGNDAQARPMGGAPDIRSLNGGGLQAGGGGGFQTPPIASVPGAGDPDQVRQQAVARALAGRMASGGGAFNQ